MNTTYNAPALQLIQINAAIFVSTNELARKMEKQHKNVLQATDELLEAVSRLKIQPRDRITSPKPGEPKAVSTADFVESTYVDDRGKAQRCVLLARNAASILVMGQTGERALRFKAEFTYAFDMMHFELYGNPESELNRLRRRVESKFPLFKAFKEAYLEEALPMPALCAQFGMTPDAIRTLGHAMVREGYVEEEMLVKARRGKAAWNALLAARSQLALDLAPAVAA